MKDKVDISWSLSVVLYKVLVPWWPLLFGVACEHALKTDTYTLYVVYRAPALTIEKVETDDTVGIDMRVPWNGVRCVFDKDHLGSLQRN
jgi:hypothetical protein